MQSDQRLLFIKVRGQVISDTALGSRTAILRSYTVGVRLPSTELMRLQL